MCARTHAHSHTMRSPWYQIIYFFRFRIFLSFHSVPWLSKTQFFLIDDRKGHTERISCIRAYEAHEKNIGTVTVMLFHRCSLLYPIYTHSQWYSERARETKYNKFIRIPRRIYMSIRYIVFEYRCYHYFTYYYLIRSGSLAVSLI